MYCNILQLFQRRNMNFGRRVFPQPVDPNLDLRLSDLYRSMPRPSIRQGLLPSAFAGVWAAKFLETGVSPPRRVLRFRISRDGVRQRLQDDRFASHTFPWAQFRRRKATIKVHTLGKLRGSIRGSIQVTGGHVQDVNLLETNCSSNISTRTITRRSRTLFPIRCLRRISTAVTYYHEPVRF